MPNKKKNESMKKPQSISALADFVPDAHHTWDVINNTLLRYARGFGFSKVDSVLLEDFAIYENTKLEHGAVASFTDPEEQHIALRPQMIPGISRVHAEHKIFETNKLAKWYYLAPTLHYNQQSKKYISNWEYGFELFGEFTPLMEVQLINLVWKFLGTLHLQELSIEVNSIGREECRDNYDDQLRSHLQSKKYELCNDCVADMESKPLAVFRCKNLGCKTVAADAPQIVDYLDEGCRQEFMNTLEGLDEIGIAYSLNPTLVGKEGSSGMVFALKYKDQEDEYLIGEGARHDDIYENATGKKMPTFGFVGHAEVLKLALQKNYPVPEPGATLPHEHILGEIKAEVFLAPLGDLASKKALRLFSELWDAEIIVYAHFSANGMKNQLKLAETLKAEIALIIGQKEAKDELVILRDVRSGMQEVFQRERIIEEVKKRLGK